jgi:uncharacterized protein (DUF342 family)
VGGTLQAFQHVEAMCLGNDSGVVTHIELINREKAIAKEKIKELEDLKGKIEKLLVPVLKEMKTKSAILKSSGAEITDRMREQVKKIVDEYNTLAMKQKYIEKKIEELTAAVNAPSSTDGYVRVRDTAFPGVELDFFGLSRKTIKTKTTNKIFKTINNEIQAEE